MKKNLKDKMRYFFEDNIEIDEFRNEINELFFDNSRHV